MISYGLMRFIQEKNLNSKKAINSYLQHKGITEFTAKNSTRASQYIQRNWHSWASFIDRSIKNGSLEGKAVKLNHYYDEQEKRKQEQLADLNDIDKDILEFAWNVVRLSKSLGDTQNKLSNVQRFIAVHEIKLPNVNKEGIHPIKRWEPKFKTLIELGYKHKLINYLEALNRKGVEHLNTSLL